MSRILRALQAAPHWGAEPAPLSEFLDAYPDVSVLPRGTVTAPDRAEPGTIAVRLAGPTGEGTNEARRRALAIEAELENDADAVYFGVIGDLFKSGVGTWSFLPQLTQLRSVHAL